jgi:hypothetical protein
MSTSFITPGHVRAFQAVTTQLYGEVTLASCLINGKPGVAIVLVDKQARRHALVRRHHAGDGHRFRRRSRRRER